MNISIDPHVAALLADAERRGRVPFERQTPAEARTAYLAACGAAGPVALPMTSVRDIDLGGVPCRLYRPESEAALPAILYLHGGGWVVGNLDSHDGVCRRLAHDIGCAIVAVDYRLAPEHRFPAQFDDALSAWRALNGQASALNLAASRLGIAGDSAGGALAASVSLACRDEFAPRFQLLFYPATDLVAATDSYRQVTLGVPLTAATMHWFRGHYAPDPQAWTDWRASPLRADLSAQPPTFVLTVGIDPLRDEGLAYAGRLADAGNALLHMHLPSQVHGLLTQARLMPASESVWQEAAEFALRYSR